MAATLRRVLMRSAANAMRDADRSAWHYGPGFNPAKAASQHAALAELVAASGAEIEWIEDKADGLSDSVFTHDPSLMTGRGALILSMGKPLRAREPSLHEETYTRLGIPILGRVEAPGQVEGGDCVWVDARTLAIGRGVRSNQEGIQQVSNLLTPLGVSVYGFDLPLWQGEEACLHLMSVISPLADDLALVYSPLLPAPFYQHAASGWSKAMPRSSLLPTASALTYCRPARSMSLPLQAFPRPRPRWRPSAAWLKSSRRMRSASPAKVGRHA